MKMGQLKTNSYNLLTRTNSHNFINWQFHIACPLQSASLVAYSKLVENKGMYYCNKSMIVHKDDKKKPHDFTVIFPPVNCFSNRSNENVKQLFRFGV